MIKIKNKKAREWQGGVAFVWDEGLGRYKKTIFPYKTKALPLLYSNGSYILLSLILTDLAF